MQALACASGLQSTKITGMDLHLKDRVVMVAGASRGLGYSVAKVAAQEGARLSICSRTKENIESAAQTLSSETGAAARGFAVDMSNGEAISRWVSDTLELYGTIDAVLVNAGGPPAGTFFDFEDREWEQAFQLTLMSAVRLIREVAPVMKDNGRGSILTLTSISVKQPIGNLILSNVMRTGVTSLVKSVSNELAPYGIRVNSIVPGYFATDRLKSLDAKNAEARGIPAEEMTKERQQSVPMGRDGSPDEFGRSAVFLLSDAAGYVTGHSFVIDGGILRALM